MGCRLTKDDFLTTMHTNTTNELSAHSAGSINKIDYKSRLERKLCLAKETPELNYDLSDCNLKDVPAGVFVLCRVLRKEILDLSKNRLTTLNGGGILNDLQLLQILDLRYNKFKQLPDDIYKLENLRELLISNNLLVKLPKTINFLKYLELLDISCNNIQSIDEINFMPRLKILNLTGNINLRTLPDTLGTCDNLCDVIIDIENFEWPPKYVLQSETMNIIKFLTTREIQKNDNADTSVDVDDGVNSSNNKNDLIDEIGQEITQNTTVINSKDSNLLVHELQTNNEENQKTKFLTGCEESNTDIDGYDNTLIKQLQMRQQKHKEELLRAVLSQQHETEYLVNKLQQQKDNEKTKLIEDVLRAEKNANLVIANLLALKSSMDHNLLEKEKLEEERLLEKLHIKHSELRKQEILATMLDELRDEKCKIEDYQNRKISSSQDILEKELEASTQIEYILQQCERNRNEIIQKICEDEELQKQAVINLIAKNDARSWGLVQQLHIVEVQLANMTQLEIQRKKNSTNEQMIELSNKRIFLTKVLTDLLEQQECRKMQLLSTILSMEAQKCNEQDYWLLQYQRLLDSRPLEFSVKTTNSIDPLLGYNFLVNGVIHCLPFLQKLWKNYDFIKLNELTNDDLKAAGIREERDRKLILKSIYEYLRDENIIIPTAKQLPSQQEQHTNDDDTIFYRPSVPSAPSPTKSSTEEGAAASVTSGQNLPECVICMEEWVKVIFLPCGHMCCCLICQTKVEICPICRAIIERKIKIVQP